MSSESKEEGVHVELSSDLDEWLDQQATALDVPRDTVVRQLLAAYRATVDHDDVPADIVDIGTDEIDAMAATAVDEKLDETVETAAENAISARLPAIVEGVEDRLESRFEEIESDVQTKIEDVRQRVVQVKRETDAKAPADHDHEEFNRLDALQQEIDALDRDIERLRTDLRDDVREQEAAVDEIADRLDDVDDKLTRVAWVVSDLREDRDGRDANQKAVDRLKRAAAQEGITSARCSNCSETVAIGLLTEPKCPHCNATVSDVRPEGGIIRTKARLVAAAQLEPGGKR